jgi:micrococcal nuclease
LLAQVGAPARGQNYSKEARSALKEMVYGQKIKVVVDREDRLGRLIAQVNVGATNVNTEMVKKGWAWVYRKFTEDPKMIAQEETARKSKIGLWQDENPVAPWEYRSEQRKLRAEQAKAAGATEQAIAEIKK